MQSRQSYEVTIAGGGLGGLTAALAMRRRGLRVTVLEQAPELGEVGAGIQSAPNASRVLIRLGLREKLEEIRTEPQDQVRRRWKDGSIIGQTPLGDRCKSEFNAPYWHYHRADLHRVILDACTDPEGAGPVVRVETDSQVADVDDGDPERPVAITSDGRRFPADVLIGADGLRSRVRDAAGFADTLRFSGEMAYRALIPGDKIAADPTTRWLLDRFQSTIWYGPGRHLVHYVINGGQYLNVVAIVPCPPELASRSSVPTSVQELVEAFPGWDDRVAAMLSKAESTGAWPLHDRRPDPVWAHGRIALLGDACHAMLPYQAQGASQAMEDSAVLAEELGAVTAADVPAALARYVSRRATRAAMVQEASLRNMDLYHLPDGPQQQERDRKLRDFHGESAMSYELLWRGTPLDEADTESFSYQFIR